jgi:large subunit ribosomal protein L7/L12
MADIKREDVMVYLENANMLEISELIKEIEDKFGVTAAAPVAIAGGAALAEGDAAGSAEEKTEFDIELTGVGEKKINVIKVIRTITSLGLKEAKELADNAPSMVKEAVSKDEAEEVKKQLEEAGATVTLK